MVYRPIDNGIKERAVRLHLEGRPRDVVADILGVNPASIRRWINNYNNHGQVDVRSGLRGRPRSISGPVADALLRLIEMTPSLYLDEMQDWLAETHGVHVCLSVIHDTLKKLGLTRKVLRKPAAQQNIDLRSQWLEYVFNTFRAEQMIFLDESSKDGRTLGRRYGRAALGVAPVEFFNHDRGDRWSILPALSLDGYIALRVVEGSVDSNEFYDFILNEVLPRTNRFPGRRSVLVMDNCAIHKSEAVRNAVEAAGCVLVFLPPYSPEFNPIEQSFSCVKAHLRRHWRRLEYCQHPRVELLNACMEAVTAEKAVGWFGDSGYTD